MDKLKSKILLISLLLILILSLQGAAAASDDGNLTSENIDLSICDNEGNVGSDNVLTAANSEDMLGEVDGSFGELQDLIDTHYGRDLTLNKSYTCNNGKYITITKQITIYGNGNTLNANDKCGIFKVTGSNVVIRDLVFTNGNATEGGAINWEGDNGTLTNCSFTNNNAIEEGGAVYWWGDNGTLTNCSFTDNTAPYGGAVFWWGYADHGKNGKLTDCNFTNNYAHFGGAVNWESESGNLANCNFTNNNVLENGGAVVWSGVYGNLTNCNFNNNNASFMGAVAWTGNNGSLTNCSFTNNKAIAPAGAVYWWGEDGNLANCNFTNNTAPDGGAVYWVGVDGNLANCNFTNNNATNGGAVYWTGSAGYGKNGKLTNCSFNNNTASNGGGAVYWNGTSGKLTNSNFTNNHATENGGAIRFSSTGVVINCNFTDNKATGDDSCGGAVYFNKNSEGNVTNCSFTNNTAYRGGAIYFDEGSNGRTINCNFTNNTAKKYYGGAVYFYSYGNVTNCNFIGNNATFYGGAVNFRSIGDVTNCNFTNNSASNWGGAIMFSGSGTVTNCNFIGNNATSYGGAVFFWETGEVTNCTFTNNTARSDGGAIDFESAGTVTNCNFTGNNATTGSAIYFYSTSATKTVSNSRFLNNRANAEALEVTKNDNNITITFTGKDNLLNAIYSNGDVTFTNVTYWSANGIATTGSSTIKPSRSNKEAGQNITVRVVVNGEIVLNDVKVTDENGMIVLDIKAGENYYITARHETDSYYTEAERTISNMTFNVNVTSQTTNNKTVNITAKSNILNEVMPGKLLFILPNNTEINATYASNGTWWAVHTFDDYGVYEVNASYTGLNNVTVNNGTVTINNFRLSVVKSANTTEVAYNSTVQFTINVTNYGSSNVTGVVVSDCLPEGLTIIEAGVISYDGRYEVVYSPGLLPDLVVPIDGENHVTYIDSSSDIAQWKITGISSGNSVILLISARANGLVMGNITNEVTVRYQENETDSIVNSTTISVIPANSSVNAEDVNVTYGDAIVVVVDSVNATGVSYQVIGVEGVVKEGTVNVGENITGLDLAAGKYAVTLTTVVNGNYTSSNYTSKITVNPADSSVIINSIADVTYGKDIIVTYSVENKTNLNITVTNADGGAIITGVNANIEGKVIISGLDAGKYTIAISNAEDSNHSSSHAEATFNVLKANSTIYAENKTFTYPEDVILVAHGENCTGINESSVVVRDLNGVVKATVKVNGFKMTISDLGAGEYTVSYNNTVDNNWNGAGNATGITILKANSSVSASDVEVTYGDSIVIVVESDNATEISYQIIGSNGTILKGTISADENITGLDLAAGEYTVNLTTIVNSNYTFANSTSKIIVKPAESTVSASDVNVTYGEPIVIVVDCENATEISYQIIDWEKVVVKDGTINTDENITGLDLAAGEYTVNLTTIVNGNYTATSSTSKITVEPAESSVSASDVKVTYGEAIIIPVSTVNAIALYYDVVDENGKIVDSDIIQSGLNITVKNLSAGSYDVTLITGVDLNHTSVTNTSRITVDPAKSSVSAEDVTVSYGEPISVAVTSANASEVSYKIMDKNDEVVVNGTVNPDEAISISELAAGDYTIELTTVTDENHTKASNSSKLHVKHVITIIIDAISGYTGEVINLTAQFKYENGDPVNEGTASLTIKNDDRQVLAVSMYPILGADDSYTSEVSDGKATFNIKLGEPGTYPYVVTYSGDDVDAVQEESTITILKLNTTVSGMDVSGKPSEEKSITVDVLDQNDEPVTNGTVTLTLNGKTYNATVDNGKAAFNVELPNPGTYNATITYNGNEYYGSSESSINANVKKLNTNAPSAEDISGKAGEKTDISIEIADENDNPVKKGTATLTIDGKTYTAEVKNGVATFKDVELPENDTVADVYYQGNDYYNSNSSTFSIKIEQDNNDTEPDNNTDENPTEKHISSKAVDARATGNPIAILLLTLFTLVITYRKK